MSYSNLSDEQLMERMLKGDRRSVEELYERYFDKLVWFAKSIIKDLSKAEDIVQELFIKLMNEPQKFDIDKKFSTWIYTGVLNRCKNLIRDETNRSRIIQEIAKTTHSSTALKLDHDMSVLQNHLVSILKLLSEKDQMIFRLKFEQELSIKEIADILNIPEGSVKSSTYYLLKKITPQLKNFNYER